MGEVNIMVATKAFGMGVDKNNIRHVIRNGIPESIVSWAQNQDELEEMGWHRLQQN